MAASGLPWVIPSTISMGRFLSAPDSTVWIRLESSRRYSSASRSDSVPAPTVVSRLEPRLIRVARGLNARGTSVRPRCRQL